MNILEAMAGVEEALEVSDVSAKEEWQVLKSFILNGAIATGILTAALREFDGDTPALKNWQSLARRFLTPNPINQEASQ